MDELTDNHTRQPNTITKTGKVLLGVFGGTFVAITAVTVPFFVPALRKICLPFVPATTRQVHNVVTLLSNHGSGKRMVDLGSGDGRIVIEAAKLGFVSEGVELNPWLVWYSRLQALRQGVSSNTKFYTKDLWKTDLSVYNSIVVFGVDSMMEPLEVKLLKELDNQGQVVVCRFPFPNWTPTKTLDAGIDTVWLYEKCT